MVRVGWNYFRRTSAELCLKIKLPGFSSFSIFNSLFCILSFFMDFPIKAHQLQGSRPSKAIKDLRWKWTLDMLIILLALPLLIPLALFITLLIRSVSSGPVLFRQERIGYLGRRFMCFKFRTMFVNADTAMHQGHLQNLINSNVPMMKMDSHGDPRIIPFGLFLRASGLDELPQLINVLRGEMSLVGPRPCLPYEYDKYLPWQKERFGTVPGLTGLWQVSGKNKTTFVEMIQLDIKYAKNKTLWWDLKIILMTIPALVIQMVETRRGKKITTGPVRPKTNYSNRAIEQYSFTKAPLVGAIRAADGEDAWMRKETKLNL
jgi:lipopolysaccharide/colanic/teichoic acid biosynthesis glycosyltransferase